MEEATAAATTGDVQALRTAIDYGVFRNHPLTKNDQLGFLLKTTIHFQHLACFELLLESGATPNSFHPHKQTPLHSASFEDIHLPYLERLVAHGVSLETHNYYLETPLHIACLHGNLPGAQYLIERGANVNARCYEHNTPVHHACFGGSHEILALLLLNGGAADLEAQNVDSQRPLHEACEHNHPQCVQLLLDRGADTEARNDDGQSSLTIANQPGRFEVFHLLLQGGANPNAQDITGRTHLHWACMMADGTPFVQALINSGANLNTQDNKGRTPLFVICEFDSLDSLDLLIAAGANATIDNNKGNTPLHMAVTSELTDPSTKLEIVNRLLESGCSPLIRNGDLLRPNDVAVDPQLKLHLEEAVRNWGG